MELGVYRIPTMAEIAATKPNGLRSASLFAGCGGSSLGYKMAGFRVVFAVEFIEAARLVYRENFPATPVIADDIRTVDPVATIESIGIKAGELEVLDGSPPCASFSTSGKREKLWGKEKDYSGTTQRTDDLVGVYVDWIERIRPKAFVFENVAGIAIGKASGVLRDFINRTRSAGYIVESRLVDASFLGVPQSRGRVFTVGIRADARRSDLEFPKPCPRRVSISDAFGNAESVEPVESEAWSKGYAIEVEWRKCKEGGHSSRYFNLIRADRRLPSPTITAMHSQRGAASVMHPTQCRKFSVAELKRLCSFPDDFAMRGTYREQAERFGRAVPPLVTFEIGRAIARALQGKNHG